MMYIKQYTSTKCGFRTRTLYGPGARRRVSRGKAKDTESPYYPTYCILWISFHLVGVTLNCFFFLLAACGWYKKKSLG